LKSEARNHDADVAIINGCEHAVDLLETGGINNFEFYVAKTVYLAQYMLALNQRRLLIITLSRERGKLNT